MAAYISVKNKDGDFKKYLTPRPVYDYILQLEAYIRYPEISKLLDVYEERFKAVKNLKEEIS